MENRLYIIISNIPKIIKNNINLSLLKNQPPPQLGRWNLVYNKKMDYKIDLANEDHCGPCGELKLKRNKSIV
jgi:hypothetical protein